MMNANSTTEANSNHVKSNTGEANNVNSSGDVPPRSGGGGGGRKTSLLVDYVDKEVSVITNDGRNILGTIRGFDQVCNVILCNSIERVFSETRGVEHVALGLYVIRGDNIAVIGQIDKDKDGQIPWDSIKAKPLKPVVH